MYDIVVYDNTSNDKISQPGLTAVSRIGRMTEPVCQRSALNTGIQVCEFGENDPVRSEGLKDWH